MNAKTGFQLPNRVVMPWYRDGLQFQCTRCGVYPDRPRQCRSWPFWRSVIDSEQRWKEEARECPGMNQGPFRPRDRIEAIARKDGA